MILVDISLIVIGFILAYSIMTVIVDICRSKKVKSSRGSGKFDQVRETDFIKEGRGQRAAAQANKKERQRLMVSGVKSSDVSNVIARRGAMNKRIVRNTKVKAKIK